uniref:ATP synthase CF0 B' subunit n=1 Tax=Biddulphia biddulphiana TaxID=1158022 RepID=A0A2U9NSE3_9STRA|nr:ATP synthase CF0 B' subunit [Biddulphia biddulphiana]AWT40037.1 ATP synthase CF0 B' subunit [Biddulphia biddulphiana]
MINFSTLILSSEANGPDGLFDIDATLPLIAIQFLVLMVILNIILYSPLLTVIAERKEYILTNLTNAASLLEQANILADQYEQQLNSVRKETQLEITNSQKMYKEIFEIELNISQTYIDDLLDSIIDDLLAKKNTALNSLETIVQSLCSEIETRLSI